MLLHTSKCVLHVACSCKGGLTNVCTEIVRGGRCVVCASLGETTDAWKLV